MAIRTAILDHMIDIAHLILDHHIQGYSSIQDYITYSNMDREFAWGTNIEILTLAHLRITNPCCITQCTIQYLAEICPQNLEL